MTLFLFLKQIVDMVLDIKWPDYMMAGFLIILVVYQLWQVRPEKGEIESHVCRHISIPDRAIGLLSMIVLVHMFVDDEVNLYQYAKILSSVLMYILGRIAYERVGESTVFLAISSYIVIYTNVIVRFIRLGYNGFFGNDLSCNGVYYYGTDLACAMLIGLIFVGMYAKNNLLKFFTIFIVCPFMVFHALAGVQRMLIWVIYLVLFLFMSERAVKRRRFTDFLLPLMIVLMLVVVMVLNMPAITGTGKSILIDYLERLKISTENFVGRYTTWNDLWDSIRTSGIMSKLFGISISGSVDIASQYIGIIYSTGFVGLTLFIIFIVSIAGYAVKIYDRRTYYVTVMLAILFLGTSINIQTINFTQLSWFPMLYAGMAVSAGKINIIKNKK